MDVRFLSDPSAVDLIKMCLIEFHEALCLLDSLQELKKALYQTFGCWHVNYARACALQRKTHLSFCAFSLVVPPQFVFLFFSSCLPAVVTAESDAMPGQIPEPSVTAGSLPSLGLLAGISATTLTDKLKFGDFQEFGTMLSPLHFLNSLGKRPLRIKTEVRKTPSTSSLFTVWKYEQFLFELCLN